MRILATIAVGLLLSAEALAAGTLAAIRFAGNDTTQPEVMLQEMSIRPGDAIDERRIEASRQAIMNLGLFKTVNTELVEEAEGTVLLVTVDEKWYILPIPRVGVRPDGEADYGIELRFDNLFGLNQRLNLQYITKDSVTNDTPQRREMSIGYSYPRIVGTPFQLDLGAGQTSSELQQLDAAGEEIGQFRHDSRSFRLNLARWHNDLGASRGLRYGGGVGLQQERFRHLSGTAAAPRDGDDVNLNGVVEFIEVDEEQFRRRGRVYGYNVTIGLPQLGDFAYDRHLFYYRRYLPLDEQRANLDYRFQLGLAAGGPFGSQAWALGGSTSLRGYPGSFVIGNAMLLSNIEYLFPLSGYRQLRGVVFSDIGNVWPTVDAVDLTDLETAVGIGLRWKIQLFVDVTLRLDSAWGLGSKTQLIYAETSTAF